MAILDFNISLVLEKAWDVLSYSQFRTEAIKTRKVLLTVACVFSILLLFYFF